MSTSKKIGLGLLTFFPFVFMFALMTIIFGGALMAVWLDSQNQVEFPGVIFPGIFFVIFPLQCFYMLIVWGLIAYYIFHVLTQAAISDTSRIFWVIMLLLMGIMALPFYWYLYIWRDDPWDPLPRGISSASAASSSPLPSTPDSPASQGFGDNEMANRSEDLPGGPKPDRPER